MGWFRKDEEYFDDSAAFESDGGGRIKIILGVIVLIGIISVSGFIGYNQYLNWKENEPNQTNQTNQPNQSNLNISKGEVMINFTDFNLTVKENPNGIYYYTTQDKVIDEECYINGKRKKCSALTNRVCAKEECTKELEIITECFVNGEKINCPE